MNNPPNTTENTASGSYKVGADADTTSIEYERLRILGRLIDPISRRHLESTGIAPGWKCLEVGGGAGTLSTWMAERVAPSGSVLSTDVDLRFHCEGTKLLEVREHDITSDPLPDDHFDLVHTRAVLQHIPARELALDRMIAALKPGGWLVVEDGDFDIMEGDHMPPAFRRLSEALTKLSLSVRDWDRHFGRRLISLVKARGLEELHSEGTSWAMKGGTDSVEWYAKAMEHAGPIAVQAGLVTRAEYDAAMAEVRSPDFIALSPLHIAVVARKATA